MRTSMWGELFYSAFHLFSRTTMPPQQRHRGPVLCSQAISLIVTPDAVQSCLPLLAAHSCPWVPASRACRGRSAASSPEPPESFTHQHHFASSQPTSRSPFTQVPSAVARTSESISVWLMPRSVQCASSRETSWLISSGMICFRMLGTSLDGTSISLHLKPFDNTAVPPSSIRLTSSFHPHRRFARRSKLRSERPAAVSSSWRACTCLCWPSWARWCRSQSRH